LGKSHRTMTSTRQLLGVWPIRSAWVLSPLTIGPSLGAALDDASRPVQLTAAALAWSVWAAVLVATLVPRTTSLTVVRTAAPAAAAAAIWSASAGSGEDLGASALVAACWGAVVVVAAFAPTTGDAFVDGSSYGDERRMPLRVPSALLLGPLPLAWLLTVGPLVAAPMLLAARQWVLGAVVAVAGVPVVASGARALHGLARRWVVFVPAGVVLHDPMSLAEPVLFRRSTVAAIGPAPADSDGVDLSRGALGLALEVVLTEPQAVGLARAGRRSVVEVTPAERLLVTPTRPGAVLAEAERRDFPLA
jgi:hypothetical protein